MSLRSRFKDILLQAIEEPPYGTRDQALKVCLTRGRVARPCDLTATFPRSLHFTIQNRFAEIVYSASVAMKDAEMDAFIQSLESEQSDVLMKFVFKFMGMSGERLGPY